MVASKLFRSAALLAATGAGVAALATASPASAETRQAVPTQVELVRVGSYVGGRLTYFDASTNRMRAVPGVTLRVEQKVPTQDRCTATTNEFGIGACTPYQGWGLFEVTFAGTTTWGASSASGQVFTSA